VDGANVQGRVAGVVFGVDVAAVVDQVV